MHKGAEIFPNVRLLGFFFSEEFIFFYAGILPSLDDDLLNIDYFENLYFTKHTFERPPKGCVFTIGESRCAIFCNFSMSIGTQNIETRKWYSCMLIISPLLEGI